MRTVVGVGACYLDTILSVPQLPAEDEKLRASSLERRRGGNVPNTLEVLQQLFQMGHCHGFKRPILVCPLPAMSSSATQQVWQSLGAGVNCDFCLYREETQEAPSSYIIRSLATGSRTVINHNSLQEMTVEEFKGLADRLESMDVGVYHFEGRIPQVTLACIQYLRRAQPTAIISVELEKPNREGLDALAAEADIVFHSRSWSEAKGYQTARECFLGQAPVCRKASYLFYTRGKNGAAGCRLAETSVPLPNFVQVQGLNVKVVDTVGAGDTFIAAILYSMFCRPQQGVSWVDHDLERLLHFANTLAAKKVGREGFDGLVDNSNVQAVWSDHSRQ